MDTTQIASPKPEKKNQYVQVDGKNYLLTMRNGKWCVRFERKGKSIRRSLETTILSVARERAKLKVREIISGNWVADETRKLRSRMATIGELVTAYRANARLRPKTVRANANALLTVVSDGAGIEDAESQPASVLTAKLVHAFEARRMAELKPKRAVGVVISAEEQTMRTTICSTLTQARSVLSPGNLHFYEDLVLPDFKGFRCAPVKRPARLKPQKPNAEKMKALFAAAPELKESNPALYLTFLLFSRLGMRNVEILAARLHWIEEFAVNGQPRFRMKIVVRPEEGFDPKGNSGSVPMSAELVQEIRALRAGASPDDFIVPAAHKTAREDIVNREHSEFVKQYLDGDESKTSYELRRYAGSVVLKLTNGNLMAVRDFLRHANVKTTEAWYAYLLDDVPAVPLDAAALAGL